MKVVILSKALISQAYRRKLIELAHLGLHVVAVVPPEWREGGSVQRLEPVRDSEYDLVVTRIRWNGHFHTHYYPDFADILRTVKPNLVHVDEEPYNVATYLAVRAATNIGVPSLFFSWQNLYRRYPQPFRSLEKSVYRNARHALAGSNAVADVLRQKGYRRSLSVVPQFGVDPDVFRPGPAHPGPFTVGFLNRMVPEKAPLMALNAFERLPVQSRLMMVGDGPLFSRLQSEIERRGLTSRVTLQPRVPSSFMPDLLRALDVVLLPSVSTPRWREQFGRIVIEAMATGLPVIASNSGELPAVLGEAGATFNEGDTNALAQELQCLYENAEQRGALGRRGRERVLHHFTHALVAQRTRDAYMEALTDSTRKR